LRLTATVSVIGMVLNVAGSIVVAPHFGAPGPLYAGLVVAVFVQTLPAIWFVRRHGVHRPGSAKTPVVAEPALAPLAGDSLTGPHMAGWAFELLRGDDPDDR